MATTKKPKAKKVIIWSKLVDKVTAPYQKKFDKLFADYDKEIAQKPMPLKEKNDLWRKKYQKKYDAIEKAEDAAYLRLWEKYHESASSTKPKEGYIIKIK